MGTTTPMTKPNGSDDATLDEKDLPSLKEAVEREYGPLNEIAAYARANPLARLRLLRAIHDTAGFIAALAATLIADELLLHEAEAVAHTSPELPHLPAGQA